MSDILVFVSGMIVGVVLVEYGRQLQIKEGEGKDGE